MIGYKYPTGRYLLFLRSAETGKRRKLDTEYGLTRTDDNDDFSCEYDNTNVGFAASGEMDADEHCQFEEDGNDTAPLCMAVSLKHSFERRSLMPDKEKITQILSKIKPTVAFDTAEGIVDNGLLDSLEFMNLIAELSEQFGIEIDVDDIVAANFNTVESMTAMVKRLCGKGA